MLRELFGMVLSLTETFISTKCRYTHHFDQVSEPVLCAIKGLIVLEESNQGVCRFVRHFFWQEMCGWQ